MIAVPVSEHSGEQDEGLVPSSLRLRCAWDTLNSLRLVTALLALLLSFPAVALDLSLFLIFWAVPTILEVVKNALRSVWRV